MSQQRVVCRAALRFGEVVIECGKPTWHKVHTAYVKDDNGQPVFFQWDERRTEGRTER